MALPNCCNDPSQFKVTLSFLSIMNGKRWPCFCQKKLNELIRLEFISLLWVEHYLSTNYTNRLVVL